MRYALISDIHANLPAQHLCTGGIPTDGKIAAHGT